MKGELTEILIPVLILFVILYSAAKRKDVYGAFCRGASGSISLITGILPYIAAVMIAMGLLRDSGILDAVCNMLSPVFSAVGLPPEILPLLITKPFSGSAAISALSDIYAQFGADSAPGTVASLIMGSTETLFYTISLYYGANGIKKTGYTIAAALIADTAAVLTACVVFSLFYK